jgi:hypothetical protein
MDWILGLPVMDWILGLPAMVNLYGISECVKNKKYTKNIKWNYSQKIHCNIHYFSLL